MTRRGMRGWLTAGTSVAAAPLVAASFLVDDYRLSFAALLVGYALRWVVCGFLGGWLGWQAGPTCWAVAGQLLLPCTYV